MNQENPFQSPQAPLVQPTEGDLSLDLGRPFRYIFENPNWLTNILLAGVMQFIPVIGPVVLLGYQFEVVIALLRQPERSCPDFDFDRFGDYLMRGLWPVICILCWSMLFGILFGVLFAAGGLGVALLSEGQGQGEMEAVMMGIFGLIFVVSILINIGVQLFAIPIMIRSALEKDLMAGMSLGYALQFVRNMWKEMLLMLCVIILAMFVAMGIGLLLFCVGIYFTMAAMMLVQAHFYFQLYGINCARGGELIPISE